MKKEILKAGDRGAADHGWLSTKYSFSFANYYNPMRMGFGLLRVLNDDTILGGGGFDTHGHENMEIITIPLFGELRHKDNMGSISILKPGDVQVMTAGTGVIHSEFNNSEAEELSLFQIWIMPKELGVVPRYDEKSFDILKRKNNFQLIVSLDGRDESLKINQDAFLYLLDLESGKDIKYELKNKSNGVFVFIIDGEVDTLNEYLKKRDSLELSGILSLSLRAREDSKLLLIEVPLI